ncbi:WD repeat-containing protein JIP5 [Cryptococcus floricola]|uniref:WD repeat-containing protein n=1 Tax=Cryptococcus floricola TaxID=2591691 RepID=A0A5D3B394_9TREE|nr:WD repeat-containing protein JIP5 [Cryptococcus floricola]
MPDITLKNQPFDVEFHPTEPVLFASLLTGQVQSWRYDDQTGETSAGWNVRPSKRTARALAIEEGGDNVWMGGKGGGLYQINTKDGQMTKERAGAHEVPINRVHCVNPNLIASGDDDGVIKFWDPRQEDAIRSYSQHFDYITDFTYFDDKRQLVTTSGDGHLSVIDIRSNKSAPLSLSENQDDELLSIVPIKNGQKAVVGSGTGVLSIWNRKQGWGDCVDRIPGHPASVDAMVAITPDIIATGSEDGMIRVIQILPHKFLGVVATHEEYPIERIKLDRNNKWLASVSHDECLKLTDMEDLFEESDDEDEEMEEGDGDKSEEEEADSDSEMEVEKSKKAKKDNGMRDMGRKQMEEEDGSFFADL